MTEQPMKYVYDIAKGEGEYIPLTAEEIAQAEADSLAFAEQEAAREAEEQRVADLKASAKAKLIAGEALTAEEAEVLVL
jgi:membrane protein involved in colicin uptake